MDNLNEYLRGWINGTVEPPPVTRLVGAELVEAQSGMAKVEMTTSERHFNPMRVVHGGIFCDLADVAMGVAMATTISEGETFSTIELHMNYFRPVQQRHLTAFGKVVRRGRTSAYVECEIMDDEGRLVAKASSNCAIQRVA